MSKTESAIELLSKPFDSTYGNEVDLKNQSYREAHKALIKVVERNIEEESKRQAVVLSNHVKLSLVGVLALVVTITTCVYLITQANMHNNDNQTRVETIKAEGAKQ